MLFFFFAPHILNLDYLPSPLFPKLDVFQGGDLEEFLVPLDRYQWRVRCLEEAISKNQGRCDGIEISTFYDDESNDDGDSDLVLYNGRLGDYGNYDRDHSDANLVGCGYQAINIQWADPDQPSNSCSPWEVTVDKPTSSQFKFSRRTLSEDEKRRAHEALKKIKRIPDVREQFVEPVDQRVYSDYLTRVELPMDLKFIERRLDANYYSSRFSLVFDVRLVMINCCKYNGENGALQDSARQMVDQFEKEMLSDEERQLYNDLKVTATTLTTETSTESRSSLENLPPPEPSSGDAGRRRSLRIRIDVPGHSPTRATRAHPDAEETQLEDITSSTYARARQPSRRRSAMEEESAESSGRARRGGTARTPARAPARQSSRRESRASLDSQSTLEILPDQRSSTRRSSRGTAACARMAHSDDESADENPESDSDESDAKPPARPTPRQAARRRPTEDSSEEESEEEVLPTGPSSRSRRASLRHGAGDESAPQTRKRKARGAASSDESEEADDDEEESEIEESPARKPAARSRNTTRTSRNASSQRNSSRRASAGKTVSYADGSESEFEDRYSEEDDEDEELVTSPPKRTSRKRRKGKFC